MSIADLNQPAKHWLADAVGEFQRQFDDGNDPSIKLVLGDFELEIRLNRAPGMFERHTLLAGKGGD